MQTGPAVFYAICRQFRRKAQRKFFRSRFAFGMRAPAFFIFFAKSTCIPARDMVLYLS
jgi:hypothetical protein